MQNMAPEKGVYERERGERLCTTKLSVFFLNTVVEMQTHFHSLFGSVWLYSWV